MDQNQNASTKASSIVAVANTSAVIEFSSFYKCISDRSASTYFIVLCVCLIISDRDKIEELTRTKCYLENKEYVKGQKMFSDQIGCYACICDENFDNTTIINSPNCQKVKCNIEIYYADRLMAGCIPIYYGKKYGKFNCCPIDWRCRKYLLNGKKLCLFNRLPIQNLR